MVICRISEFHVPAQRLSTTLARSQFKCAGGNRHEIQSRGSLPCPTDGGNFAPMHNQLSARPGRLAGKIALVMGAGSRPGHISNGSAVASAFAREGAHVICCDKDLEAARCTAVLIEDHAGSAEAASADVTDEAQVAAAVRSALDKHSTIDILHNNVGVTKRGGIIELTEADWQQSISTNLMGAIFAIKHVLPAMIKNGTGSIINVSSIAAIRYTGDDYPSYYATKAALSHLTRTSAVQYGAHGVRVNAILPGLIRTDMVARFPGRLDRFVDEEAFWKERAQLSPMKRIGSPTDVAEAAVFLGSDESGYITGAELVVDGGLSLRI